MQNLKLAIMEANVNLALAADLIQAHMPLIDAFLEEEKHVDSVMPILNPTLYMSKERQETAAVLSPVYRTAKAFAEALAAAQASIADTMREAVVDG